MALYESVDKSIKQRKQKLNNSHIRNLKIMNILNVLVMVLLILIDIFLLEKGVFTGMPLLTTIMLIAFVVLQIGSLVVFAIKRFARASMVTKVGIMIICFLPIIPYIIYLQIGNNIYIACLIARIICLAALAMLLFNTKTTNDKKTFGVKGVPLAIASIFTFLALLYIFVSPRNRKVLYSYDDIYQGYVLNNVLSGKGKVKIKEDTVAISNNSLKNVNGNLVIHKNVKYIAEDAFKDSNIKSLTIYSTDIELMNAINNSNIEKIYLETDECNLDIANLNKEIDILSSRDKIDNYRNTYRKYDYLFIPIVDDDEYYVCFNGTTLPVYIYKEEKTLEEPDRDSLPKTMDGNSIIYDGYYIKNDSIEFPIKVNSNTKINSRYSYIYNISYDFSNCDNDYDLPIEYYDKLGEIELPELEMDGFVFSGWYILDEYGNYTKKCMKLDSNINSDINLKAKFLKKFKVTYNKILDEATLDLDNEIIYTEEDTVKLDSPELNGFTFDGWYLDSSYNVKATTYLNQDTILYAKWIINNQITLSNNIDKVFDNESELVSALAQTELDNVLISYSFYDELNNLIINDNEFNVINANDSNNYYVLVNLNYNNLIINNIKSEYINVNIQKAKYDMTSVVVKDATYIYDGYYHVPVLTGTLPTGLDGLQITYSFDEGIKYCGKELVNCNFNTISNNYEIPESIPGLVEITPREVSINWNYSSPFEYDGETHFPEYALRNVLSADLEYVKCLEDGRANGVGTHIAKITSLASKDSSSNIYKNYKLTSNLDNLQIEYNIVSKLNYIEGIIVEDVEAVYDGLVHLPNVENIPSGIEAIYSISPINVGTYNVKVTFKYTIDSENEKISNEYIREVKITQRKLNVKWLLDGTDTNFVEFDNKLHIPEYVIQNRIGNDEISLNYSSVNSINAGTYTINYLSISGASKDNYELPDGNYEYVITPKEIPIDFSELEFEDISYQYNGKNQYPIIDKNKLRDGVIVTYSGYGKDAGEYEVTATFSINSLNYVIKEETSHKQIIVTITPIIADIRWDQTSFVYDGNEHIPTASVSNLINGDRCDVTVQILNEMAIEAGDDYVAKAIDLSNHNYALPNEEVLTTFSISPKDYDFDYIFENITVTYDGNSHRPEVVFDGEEPEWLIVEYSEGRTDAGVTTVTATFTSTDVTYNVPSPVTATVTIIPLEAQISFELENNVYNGQAIYPRAIITNLIAGDEAPEVILEGYQNNINVGLHDVYVSDIIGNNNYKISERIQCTYEIIKATYDMSNVKFVYTSEEENIIEFVYDGYNHYPEIIGDMPIGVDGISVTYTVGEGIKNVGTKTIYVSFIGSANYNDIPSMQVMARMLPKEVNLTWSGSSFVYTGNIIKPECILSGLVLNDVCDYTLVAQGVNVGRYSASITGLSNSNYILPANNTFEYEITPATINLNGLTFNSASKTYDSTILYPEMVGSLPDNVEISYEGLTSDAGMHTITINFIVGANYKDIPSVEVNVEIIRRPISIEWTSLEATYTGLLSYPSYRVSNIIAGDECEITVIGGGIDVGEYTVTVTGISNSNYVLESQGSVTYVIVKADYDMSNISFNNVEVEYNGQMQKPIITGILPSGVSVEYSDGATNVSDGIVTVVATFKTTDENYNAPRQMSATIKVLPKELTISWSNLVYTYDGSKHSPTAIISGLIGSDECDIQISGYGINAGTYECMIASLSNSNYVATSTTTLTINKALYDMSNIKFEDATFTYNGQLQHQTISGLLSSVVGLDGISPEVDTYIGSVKNVSDGIVECVVKFKTASTNYEIPLDLTCNISVSPITLDLNITLDTNSSTKASVQSWSNSYQMYITYDGITHGVLISASENVIGSDNPVFSIDGTFKNYNGGNTYIFNISSSDSNYTSTYTILRVNVNQLNTGYWWNNLQANWWSTDPSGLEDVVLVYTHKDLGIEYIDTEPLAYGSYYLSYKSITENVVISNSPKSSSTYDVSLTVDSLKALIDYLDSDDDGIIDDYFSTYAVEVYYDNLGVTDSEIEEIIENSYAATADSATFIEFTANNTSTSSMCKVTGNMANVGVSPKTYMNHEFKKALKLESATNISLDLTDTNYSTIILVVSQANGYVKINGSTYQANSDGILRLGLNNVTSLTITKSTSMNLYGIILV